MTNSIYTTTDKLQRLSSFSQGVLATDTIWWWDGNSLVEWQLECERLPCTASDLDLKVGWMNLQVDLIKGWANMWWHECTYISCMSRCLEYLWPNSIKTPYDICIKKQNFSIMHFQKLVEHYIPLEVLTFSGTATAVQTVISAARVKGR